MRRFYTAIAVLLVIIAACGGGDPTATTASNAQPSATPPPATATADQATNTPPSPTATSAVPDDVRVIPVTLTGDLAFKPGFIEVSAGEKVRFVLKNEASFFHTFTIATSSGKEEILVDVPLNGGEERTADLTIPEGAGNLYLFCKPHEFTGMVATILVDGNMEPVPTATPAPQPTKTPVPQPAATATAVPAATAAPVATATSTPVPTSAPTATVPSGPRIIPLATTANLTFSPNVIQASPGEKLKFLVQNTASFFHTFTVATSTSKGEILADLSLNGGETKSIEITMPEEEGELYIFCRPHEGLGMVGSITVAVAGGSSQQEQATTPPEGTPLNPGQGNGYDY